MLSIVCVTKNDSQGLSMTLNSLLSMNPRIKGDVEIIVIDGSEVSHHHICQKYIDVGMLKIKYFNQSDQSLYHAMNIGLNKAKKKLIWFLNGGDCATDYIEEDGFVDEITYLYNNDKIGAYGCISHNGERGKVFVSKFKIVHQGVIYPKVFHEKIGLYVEWKGFSAADYLFIRKMFSDDFEKVISYNRFLVCMEKPGLSSNIRHYICRDFIDYVEDKGSVFYLIIKIITTCVSFYSLGLLRKFIPVYIINYIKK